MATSKKQKKDNFETGKNIEQSNSPVDIKTEVEPKAQDELPAQSIKDINEVNLEDRNKSSAITRPIGMDA